jgi:hypothetical protein
MLPTFASDFAQSLGPTAGDEDATIIIFAGDRMDGHVQVVYIATLVAPPVLHTIFRLQLSDDHQPESL